MHFSLPLPKPLDSSQTTVISSAHTAMLLILHSFCCTTLHQTMNSTVPLLQKEQLSHKQVAQRRNDFVKIVKYPAPSSCADSSRLSGSPFIYVRITSILNALIIPGITYTQKLFVNPSPLYSKMLESYHHLHTS